MKGAILMLLGSVANAAKLYQQAAVQMHAVAPEADRSVINDLYMVGSGKSLKIEGYDIDVIWIYLIIVLVLVGVIVGVILCCCGGKKEGEAEEKKEGDEENKDEEKKEGEEEKKEGEGEEAKAEWTPDLVQWSLWEL